MLHMFVLRNSSCSSNAMWVDMLCHLSSCWQFDWLLCSCSDGQECLAADFSGGQRRVASNHHRDLTAFIIDHSWSWSGLSTQSDGNHWSSVNRTRLDETLRNESLRFVVRFTQVYRCDYYRCESSLVSKFDYDSAINNKNVKRFSIVPQCIASYVLYISTHGNFFII